jgi:outer membrane biosynthesis protein TonB
MIQIGAVQIAKVANPSANPDPDLASNSAGELFFGRRSQNLVRVSFVGSPMPLKISRIRSLSMKASAARICVMFFCAAITVVLTSSALFGVNAQQTPPAATPDNLPAAQAPAAQQPAADQTPQLAPAPAPESQTPAQAPQPDNSQPARAAPPAETAPASPASPTAPSASSEPSHVSEPAEITEDEIRHLLNGKQLFLRGGYLDNDLSYNEHGVLVGHSPQGSYTLSAIQIDKVRLTKHKLELEGQRFGLHFLGALPYEDPTKAVDQVNITPKKKVVKITIDRELVVKPKEKKEKGKSANPAPKTAIAPSPATVPAPSGAAAPAPSAGASDAPDTTDAQADAQAEIAATPAAERPADAKSVTTTISQAHANTLLRGALDNVFAQGFDTRLMDSMPDFWKLYYAAVAAKADYRPADPAVLRQSMVDQKAHLTSTFEPASNQYAQDHGVAGMCLYHVVIGADGKPGEIAVARPIGFGLDESAVDSIRKATFQPAIKGGVPVPVMLDLIVEFRIYSKRTAVTGNPDQQPAAPSLPGPYSVQQPPSPQ